MNYRDLAERLVWTVIAAALGNVTAGAFFDVDALQAAAMAGITAAVNFVLIVARYRLSVLPEPGGGLPGLEVEKPPVAQVTVHGIDGDVHQFATNLENRLNAPPSTGVIPTDAAERLAREHTDSGITTVGLLLGALVVVVAYLLFGLVGVAVAVAVVLIGAQL